MAFSALVGDGGSGDFIVGQKWKALAHAEKTRTNFNDHETRISDLEDAAPPIGDIVGTSDAQILTNKTIAGASNTLTVRLANDVTGDLPFANLTQGSALSVLGVTGNATADHASIVAASDGQVLRRSGTAVGFGAVDLANANAITGALPLANLPTNFKQEFVQITTLTDAQIKALPTTGIVVVSAPGSGYRVKVTGITYIIKSGSGAYTNVDTTYSDIHLEMSTGSYLDYTLTNDTAFGMTVLTAFLANAHELVHDSQTPYMKPLGNGATVGVGGYLVVSSKTSAGIAVGSWDNSTVSIKGDNNGSGDYMGGHAANTLKVIVYYTKEAL